ncbi:MAG: hypothetical protein A2057_08195 [Ignavibacteria bacterium GWA2_35_9]|nr:MAG: hypothetical protein A2057_08195 [Ignavibacteria bacterium GWA2_35_9]OGU51337.1 MAG: hypothetical protein A2080_10775 [Ignavibacteria bacterium GWC2_36_12]
MDYSWKYLRSFNSSKNLAFEELCCQLAACEENVPKDSVFERKGTPDAGVECFWTLPNKDEWGWQAKFFLDIPNSTQWVEIDKSVKTALSTHPKLQRYYVCLPLDKPDARKPNQKSFAKKWEERVNKWNKWTSSKKMKVQFIYWGNHQIFERLSKDVHRGRRFFWFNEEYFSKEWFEEKLAEIFFYAGPRYTSELNIKLEISKVFEGLGRTEFLYKEFEVLFGDIKIKFEDINDKDVKLKFEEKYNELKKYIDSILAYKSEFLNPQINYYAFPTLNQKILTCSEFIWNLESLLDEYDRNNTSPDPNRREGIFSYTRHKLKKLNTSLAELKNFVESDCSVASNYNNLLIVGKAGIGKTHLICDIGRMRIEKNRPSVILLGEHFNDSDPFMQIIKFLDIKCDTFDEFLGALNSSAEANNTLGFIFIDALNEGDGKLIWKKYLPGLIKKVERHKNLKLIMSVRSSYEEVVIPDIFDEDILLRINHYGFADDTYNATESFFEYYKIETPSIPLLIPEFNNPLFLKKFCEALVNSNLTRIPKGLNGISQIFDFYISSINKKLSVSLGFDEKDFLVNKSIEKFAEELVLNQNFYLKREIAKKIIDEYLTFKKYEDSLFRNLLHEGIIHESKFYAGDNKYEDGISLSYEKFTDHYKAKTYLQKHFDFKNPTVNFTTESILGELLKDEDSCWFNKGLIESLSIQIPEKLNTELVELAPQIKTFHPVKEAFMDSLIWRDHKYFTKSTDQYINDYIIKDDEYFPKFLDTLLLISSNPDHPYNGNRLHNFLVKHKMSERDAFWSTFLSNEYGNRSSVDRIIEWAWNNLDINHYDEESLFLICKTLCWFFTTTHRFVRDRATKALVNILTSKLHFSLRLLDEFKNINDFYVLERIFACIYGAVLRNPDNNILKEVSEYIYDWQFKNENPIPNILLRDYARGIIDYAIRNKVILTIDTKKIEPPYNSKWLEKIPSEKIVKNKFYIENAKMDIEYAQNEIYESVMGFGDFARYIIGTNWHTFKWSNKKLKKENKLTKKERFNNFLSSLTLKEKEKWGKFDQILFGLKIAQDLDFKKRTERYKHPLSDKELKELQQLIEKEIIKKFRGRKRKELIDFILPYRKSKEFNKDESLFDLKLAQRFILNKVFQLGWRKENFGYFDRYVDRGYRYGRGTHKPERIGKKYQWLAYYEFLARVADNFEFHKDNWSYEEKYEGTWQEFIRNIDPSNLLKNTYDEDWRIKSNPWWISENYNNWNIGNNLIWIKTSNDIPNGKNLIEVQRPDNSDWLLLEGFYRWEEPTPPDKDHSKIPKKELYFFVKSYFIHKTEKDKIFKWAKEQNWYGRWMPESHSQMEIFLGEFFSSKAYDFHNIPYYNHAGWTKPRINGEFNFYVSTDQYLQETGYDCSIDDSIKLYLPSELIVKEMKLHWKGNEGHYYDSTNNLVTFDPSIKEKGPSCLLINKNIFTDFLNNSDYEILWTVAGEKYILGSTYENDNYVGRLQINGAYCLFKDELIGTLHSKFEPPRNLRSEK